MLVVWRELRKFFCSPDTEGIFYYVCLSEWGSIFENKEDKKSFNTIWFIKCEISFIAESDMLPNFQYWKLNSGTIFLFFIKESLVIPVFIRCLLHEWNLRLSIERQGYCHCTKSAVQIHIKIENQILKNWNYANSMINTNQSQ